MASGEVLLLLGGNVGDVRTTHEIAMAQIAERIGPVVSRSRQHWTEPWGFTDTRLFLNQAVIVRTALASNEVLDACLAIERGLGRVRNAAVRYGARNIDIDILLFGERVVSAPGITIPHPRLHERSFALAPAADIAPQWQHPLLHHTVLQLLDDLRTAS